jgi:hypothetical protein
VTLFVEKTNVHELIQVEQVAGWLSGNREANHAEETKPNLTRGEPLTEGEPQAGLRNYSNGG